MLVNPLAQLPGAKRLLANVGEERLHGGGIQVQQVDLVSRHRHLGDETISNIAKIKDFRVNERKVV